MIYSIVTMIIKEGRMEDFLEECRKIRPLVLEEEGCLMYDYTREMNVEGERQDAYYENRITLYERWVYQDALDLHSSMAYMDEFGGRVADMRASVTIRTGVEAF